MVVVFDLNGTLLDTSALSKPLRSIFGRKVSVDHWFTAVLQQAEAMTLGGDFREFGDLAAAVLKMLADGHGIAVKPEQIQAVRSAMLTMPAFTDVVPGLRRLQKAGHRLAVLTNSGRVSLALQLQNAGLREFFAQTLSVESVGLYKPAPEVYRFATEVMAAKPADMLMVAAHHWDLLAAARRGYQTAFIRRPGRALLPGESRPTYVVDDLKQLADELAEKRSGQGHAHGSTKVWGLVSSGIALAAGIAALRLASGIEKRGESQSNRQPNEELSQRALV